MINMTKKTIRLTEQELHKVLYVATKEVIKEMQEMTAKQAAIVSGSNAAAAKDYAANQSIDAEVKWNRADLLRLPAITKAMLDKFGNFKIKFIERNDDDNMTYVDYFVFDCVVLFSNTSCIMKGEISIGGRPYKIGYVRYLFSENKWQRVRFESSRTPRVIANVEPFVTSEALIDNITGFVKEVLEYEAKFRSNAMNNQIIKRKPRKPLTLQAKTNLYGDYLASYQKKKARTPTETL